MQEETCSSSLEEKSHLTGKMEDVKINVGATATNEDHMFIQDKRLKRQSRNVHWLPLSCCLLLHGCDQVKLQSSTLEKNCTSGVFFILKTLKALLLS